MEHALAGALPEGCGNGEETREDDEVHSFNHVALHACVDERRAAEDPDEIAVPFLLEAFLDELGLKLLDGTAEGFCGGVDPPRDVRWIEVGRGLVEGGGGEDYDALGWIGPVAVVGKHEEVVHVLAEEDDGDEAIKLWKAVPSEVCGGALGVDRGVYGIWMDWEVVWTIT